MSFEQLKREATALERQLEEKMARYQQLSQKLYQSSHLDALARVEEGGGGGNSSSSSLSLFPQQQHTWEEEEALLQPELVRLIQRLSELISSRLSSAAMTPSQHASVKRYREILQDVRSDLDQSLASVRRAKERRELLQLRSNHSTGSSSNGGTSPTGAAHGVVSDPAMEHLMRERNHIHNSMNTAASVIGQADAIRQDLYGQGRSLRNTGSLMATLTNNIPGLNTLVEQIRRRRSREDKIVAGVIATCILFTLWYAFG